MNPISSFTRLLHAASFARVRTALVLALLFASTLQGFIAQAHLHVPPHASSGANASAAGQDLASAAVPSDEEDRGKRTRGDASSTCPLCQAHLLGGAPLAQSAPPVFVPVLANSLVPVDLKPALVIAAVSYSWTGRGPPRV